jgi:glycosyltransferase involved in cell wall biosynthesis
MLVSAIIPTCNRASNVAAAVKSAMAQTHEDLEIIVVDDGSTDDTPAVLDGFGNDIRVLRQPNLGPSAARNRGADTARGEVLAFLDSDDQWLPEKISRQVALMERAGPRMSCCVCNATIMRDRGEILGESFEFAGLRPPFIEGEWTNPQQFLATRFLLFNQVLAVRRDVFMKTGGFNENLRLLEDYDLSFRLAATGTWGVITDPLLVKFNHESGIGVACMSDRLAHARAGAGVISGLINGQHAVTANARRNLMSALRELNAECAAHRMIMRKPLPLAMAGHAIQHAVNIRKFIRRRLPGAPAFNGWPL